jgi:hypothetical protein
MYADAIVKYEQEKSKTPPSGVTASASDIDDKTIVPAMSSDSQKTSVIPIQPAK